MLEEEDLCVKNVTLCLSTVLHLQSETVEQQSDSTTLGLTLWVS